MGKIKSILIRYRTLIVFAIVGFINTGVDFSVFSIMLLFNNMNVLVAQAFAYIAGLTCSFFLNKYFTFENKSKDAKQALLFVLVNVATMAVSVLGIYLLNSFIGIQEHIAKLFFITPLTMILNYLGYRFVVFPVEKQIMQDCCERDI